VTDVNEAPAGTAFVAVDDAVAAAGASVTVDLLANDLGVDQGENPSVVSFADVVGGSASVNVNGTVQVSLAPGVYAGLGAGRPPPWPSTYTASDGQSSSTASAAITFTGVNDAPTALALSASTIAENQAGAVVGMITVMDADANDAHTFAVSDDRFEVVDGQLKLKAGVALDFEAGATIDVIVTATDSGLASISETFTIGVANDATDDPPPPPPQAWCSRPGRSAPTESTWAPPPLRTACRTAASRSPRDGEAVTLTGNTWKKVSLGGTRTVTENTILEFEFTSAKEGELHAIGLDLNDGLG
jgi:hypothetical protein